MSLKRISNSTPKIIDLVIAAYLEKNAPKIVVKRFKKSKGIKQIKLDEYDNLQEMLELATKMKTSLKAYDVVFNDPKKRKIYEQLRESDLRQTLVNQVQEFADMNVTIQRKVSAVSTIIPGWKDAVQKYGVHASIEDLREVKEALTKLVREDGKCCPYPVHEAARNGVVKLMDIMLSTSYDMNVVDQCGWTALHVACNNSRTEIVRLFIQSSTECGINLNAMNDCGWTVLHLACLNGITDTVLLLIQSFKEYGINLWARDNFGFTALDLACYHFRTEIVQLFIQYSKEYEIDLNSRSQSGFTPLHLACYNGRTEIVQLLIQSSKEYRIDLNAKNNTGGTALHLACFNGRTEIVQLLIQSSKEYGIDLNAKNNNGGTALHLAFVIGRTEIVQLLFQSSKEYGIDLNAVDNFGFTASAMAEKKVFNCLFNPQNYGIDQFWTVFDKPIFLDGIKRLSVNSNSNNEN